MTNLKTFFSSLSLGEGLRMSLVLSVTAIFAATVISVAQSFSNTPNDTINMVGMMEDLETLSIQQQNISANAITLKWK